LIKTRWIWCGINSYRPNCWI